MKTEEEIVSDFWTQKTSWLKNVLRYGAAAFEISVLYNALLQEGFQPRQVKQSTVKSFFGTECPALLLSLCGENDITVIENPGIRTLDMTVQSCREPVSLTGASVESVITLIKTYIEHYPRYSEQLEKLTGSFRLAAKEEAKRQKLKKLALANIHLVVPRLFARLPYQHYLKTEETRAVLAVKLPSGKTLEIKLPYENFQTALPLIEEVIAQMEAQMQTCALDINITDTDYWNGEGFTPRTSPNK